MMRRRVIVLVRKRYPEGAADLAAGSHRQRHKAALARRVFATSLMVDAAVYLGRSTLRANAFLWAEGKRSSMLLP